MQSRSKLALVTCASAMLTTGCYSTWDVAPRALVKLDGFRAGQQMPLPTQEGDTVTFDQDTTLHFQGVDGIEADAQFQSIEIEGPVLHGVTRGKGDQLNVDLGKMSKVEAKTAATPAKTALITTGVVLGTGSVIVGVLGLIAITSMGGGRPLRVNGSDVPTRADLVFSHARARGARSKRLSASTRQRLFSHWAQEASSECASIPAFLALARDLAKANAPRSLIDAVLRAAREEVNHTQLCAQLAGAHGDGILSAVMPDVPEQFDSSREALIERLVLEAFWDGCVAEGAAAKVARRSLSTAKDEETRLALQTIAHDEDNHAKLARDIIAFGLSVGGRGVRNALWESFERKRVAEETALLAAQTAGDPSDDEGVTGGLPAADQTFAARVETWEKSVAMLAHL